MKYTILAIIFFVLAIIITTSQSEKHQKPIKQVKNKINNVSENVGRKINEKMKEFTFSGLRTNTNKASINLDKVLSGGPGKDGIPAIDNPKFVSIENSNIDDDVRGVLVDMNNDTKFYPYNILVWHEIVNDDISGKAIAVTFCPLCGSAIVFDRDVEGEILNFGVSGLLFESNLLMYDRKTESLWSQARGEAVIGDYLSTKLNILPMQLISFSELEEKYPNAKVLSDDTGYSRDYSFYPYGDYEETERLIFPVSVNDKKFPSKEIMYVIPVGDNSVSFPQKNLEDGEIKKFEVDNIDLVASKDGGEIIVKYGDTILAGYYEMWFSWVTHHQDDGIVWDI